VDPGTGPAHLLRKGFKGFFVEQEVGGGKVLF
jgi:hypothetical protein